MTPAIGIGVALCGGKCMGRIMLAGVMMLAFGAAPAFAGHESPPAGPVISETGEGDDWSVIARVFAGYDSNVPQVGDADPYFTGRTHSLLGGISVNATWSRRFADGWSAGLAARMDATGVTGRQSPYIPGSNDHPSSYSLFAIAPSVFAERDFVLAGMPASAGASYDFRYETAEVHAAGMTQNGVSTWFSIEPVPLLDVKVAWSRQWHDFEVEFPDPSLDDRDGVHDRISIAFRRELPGPSRHIGFGYAWSRENANGSNFDYTAHAVSAEFATLVTGPFHARLRGSVEWRDYGGFVSGFITPPGRTEMTVSEIEVTGLWVINADWMADASVKFIRHDANDPVFSQDRVTVGVGLTRKY